MRTDGDLKAVKIQVFYKLNQVLTDFEDEDLCQHEEAKMKFLQYLRDHMQHLEEGLVE